MNNRERAEKIYKALLNPLTGLEFDDPTDLLAAQIDEAVRDAHRDIAAEQALIHGEAVMLGGKLVTNEELYKQPTDYVKEAFAEGYAAAREQAAGIAEKFEPDQCTRAYAEGYIDAIDDASRGIRAMSPKPGEVGK